MAEYLSIKDFAEKAGVTKQAVYSRLSSQELSSFIQVEQGKKTISIKALPLFSNKHGGQVDSKESIKSFQDELMQNLIITLQKQLEEKDKQIAEKDKQISDLTQALLNEQKALQQANTLHAGTMRASLVESTTGVDPEPEREVESKRRWKWWKR